MLCSALLATTKLPLTWLWLSRVGSVTSTESTSTRPRPRPSRLPFDLFRSSFCDCCYFILHLRSTIFIIIYSYWITVFLDHYSFIHYSPPRPAALTSAPRSRGRALGAGRHPVGLHILSLLCPPANHPERFPRPLCFPTPLSLPSRRFNVFPYPLPQITVSLCSGPCCGPGIVCS